MLWRWLPWRFVVSRLARSYGIIDPVALLSRIHRFAQPAEVTEPIELLRAGLVFHARGLINTRAIQHNLDWVWPYWIERQFNPLDASSFIPRAFSVTHVNLTQRNWTAVGVPDCAAMPIVDPRGLVTPLFDGWSIDAWVLPDEGEAFLPSRQPAAEQTLELADGLAVRTLLVGDGARLETRVGVEAANDEPVCRIDVDVRSAAPGWAAVSIRPANPEGVSFITDLTYDASRALLQVNHKAEIRFDEGPDRMCMSRYRQGDVYHGLRSLPQTHSISCDIGLASAAALYRVSPALGRRVCLRVPLGEDASPRVFGERPVLRRKQPPGRWADALQGTFSLQVPDARMRFLFDAAVRSLILHSPAECYPGPYTSKRFWFRDAGFIVEALLSQNQFNRAGRILEHYPGRQTAGGYFRSQEGEWDSNGLAIWTLRRFRQLSGRPLSPGQVASIRRGGHWIIRKRLRDDLEAPYAGLLPAGFSAEHLGPNDYYFWDDFWSVGGLRAAAAVMREVGAPDDAARFEQEARLLLAAVDRSLAATGARRDGCGVPASPHRRMDSGAIGTVPASYPLRLWEPRDRRLLATADFLLRNCMVHGGFFQDMMHSGINIYLSLQLAQVLLRAGDPRWWSIVQRVAEMASPTGQWPEAVHPHSGGGCMGDGQHMWAAAEWVLFWRNAFVREEEGCLVIGSGIPPAWLAGEQPLGFGPTPTPYGPLRIEMEPRKEKVTVRWAADWRGAQPTIRISLPGWPEVVPGEGRNEVVVAGAKEESDARYAYRHADQSV